MLPEVTRSQSTSIPGSCQPASDMLKNIIPVLVAALASLFLGANMVEEFKRSGGCNDVPERIRSSW